VRRAFTTTGLLAATQMVRSFRPLLKPPDQREVTTSGAEMRRLVVLSKKLSENFCYASAVHLGGDFRNRILDVGGQLGELDKSVPVRVAVEERID
jgi:hypothetical protein